MLCWKLHTLCSIIQVLKQFHVFETKNTWRKDELVLSLNEPFSKDNVRVNKFNPVFRHISRGPRNNSAPVKNIDLMGSRNYRTAPLKISLSFIIKPHFLSKGEAGQQTHVFFQNLEGRLKIFKIFHLHYFSCSVRVNLFGLLSWGI